MRRPPNFLIGVGLGAVALSSSWVAAPAAAQDVSASPTYETLNLSAGFRPDPFTRALRAGGSYFTEIAGCTMYIYASAPDFDLNYQAGSLPLIFTATADSDLLLLVNTPDGRWHCDDDSGDGLDPMLTFSSPLSGNYNIWVGTYADLSGNLPTAELRITELRSNANGGSSSRTSLDVMAQPIYRTWNLSAGFRPDPHTQQVRAGGSDRVPDLGTGCRGYVHASAPDIDLNYTAGSLPLNIYAQSDRDLTLIVNQPDGSWICSDDVNGTNPHVRIATPMSGNYNIWVGTYSQSTSGLPNATVYVSELSPRW